MGALQSAKHEAFARGIVEGKSGREAHTGCHHDYVGITTGVFPSRYPTACAFPPTTPNIP
jgi:hypothetical protein